MNPQYKDAFLQGFGSVFRQWTALELAVFNCWGGPQSAEKANYLMNEVLSLFDNPKTIYKDVNRLSIYYLPPPFLPSFFPSLFLNFQSLLSIFLLKKGNFNVN